MYIIIACGYGQIHIFDFTCNNFYMYVLEVQCVCICYYSYYIVRRLATTLSKRFSSEEVSKLGVHICSINNFPTAAGLASSASGYACLGKATPTKYIVPGY